jgi:hypothetical protein
MYLQASMKTKNNVQFFFNFRGINVLNQKSELTKAFEKQREKMINHAKQEESNSSISNELQKEISKRNARHEESNKTNEKNEFVNEEYLNIRAKLKHSDVKLT